MDIELAVMISYKEAVVIKAERTAERISGREIAEKIGQEAGMKYAKLLDRCWTDADREKKLPILVQVMRIKNFFSLMLDGGDYEAFPVVLCAMGLRYREWKV